MLYRNGFWLAILKGVQNARRLEFRKEFAAEPNGPRDEKSGKWKMGVDAGRGIRYTYTI